MYCKLFEIDLSIMTSKEIEERCKGCLENTGEDCQWVDKVLKTEEELKRVQMDTGGFLKL